MKTIINGFFLLAVLLAGCERPHAGMPWRKKEIPLTPPIEVTPVEQSSSTQPASQPAPSAPGEVEEKVSVEIQPPPTNPTLQSESAEQPTVESAPMPLIDLAPAPSQQKTPADSSEEDISDEEKINAEAEGREPGRKKDVKRSDGPETVAVTSIRVNNSFITVEDLLESIRDRLSELPKHISENTFRQKVQEVAATEVEILINQELVLAEAQRRMTDEQKKYIDEEVDKFQTKLLNEAGGSKTKINAQLGKFGTNLESLVRNYRRNFTVRFYLHNKLSPAVSINRRMLWDYYQRNKSEFSSPKKVQMQIIAVLFDEFLPEDVGEPTELEISAAKKSAYKYISRSAERLAAGQDFAEVVTTFSRGAKGPEGGIWPLMAAGSFKEAKVEAAAFELQEGQVSDIIETDDAYYIVKARKIQPGKIIGFEEAQEEITDKLFEQQLDKLQQDYFARARQGAIITGSKEFLQFVNDRAVELYWGK